jgi:hypothetical protein
MVAPHYTPLLLCCAALCPACVNCLKRLSHKICYLWFCFINLFHKSTTGFHKSLVQQTQCSICPATGYFWGRNRISMWHPCHQYPLLTVLARSSTPRFQLGVPVPVGVLVSATFPIRHHSNLPCYRPLLYDTARLLPV